MRRWLCNAFCRLMRQESQRAFEGKRMLLDREGLLSTNSVQNRTAATLPIADVPASAFTTQGRFSV